MLESGSRDYHHAKQKAASRLNIKGDDALPRNSEIEQALREHQALFFGEAQRKALRVRREAALEAMLFFRDFSPRLAGPVWEGTADSHSLVQLHMHDDDAETIARFLQEQRIPAQLHFRRLRLDRARDADLPVWRFQADDLGFELIVLPYGLLRQAPLSDIDGKPMKRGSIEQLESLLRSDEMDGLLKG